MSIASDARYRDVTVDFHNNLQDGSEFVQLLAKPAAGAWAVQRTFPVAPTDDQEMAWETALPLYAYDIALRYLIGSVPAVGYESSDPDAWTAPTAAGSKGTVTTSSAAATALAGSYSSATAKLTLSWACAQLAVPFLIEKSANGMSGWSTVVADLVALSYQYTPVGGELNTTLYFRVTPKRSTVAGPVGDATAIYVGILVGTPTLSAPSFSQTTAQVSLAWTAASEALQYLVEKSPNGTTGWSTIATVPGLSYAYTIVAGEENTTLYFRVTGQNGAVSGAASNVGSVLCTLVLGVSTMSTVTARGGGVGVGTVLYGIQGTGLAGTGPATSMEVEWSFNGAVDHSSNVDLGSPFIDYPEFPVYKATGIPANQAVTPGTYAARCRSKGAGGIVGPWSNTITAVMP